MLLVFGQHSKCRKIVISDPNWLEETFRKEDFITGLDNVSTHVYTKSISGNFRGRVGHCSWNRTNGAMLMPDKWCNLAIRWKDSQYQVLSDDKTVISGQFAHDAPFGLSYLIMQSTDNSQPGKGVYIRHMQKNTI